MIRRMSKKEVLSLLKDKKDGKISDSYKTLERKSGYSSRHLKRMAEELSRRDIDDLAIHGNTGNISHNAASKEELEFYDILKDQYPRITIAQFKDYVDEDYLKDEGNQDRVKEYSLRERSYSFFQRLFKAKGWRSPVKHRVSKNGKTLHLIREPMPRRGMLVQIDGTPHDWFADGRRYCLHLAVDDATSEVLAGWFTENECQYGYIRMMRLILMKHGIPVRLYSDKHTIFKGKDGNYTQFGSMMKDLGIEMIYANTAEAKGRIERSNRTEQNRIINDIKRFKVKGHKIDDYDDLNIWFNDFYIGYINEKFASLSIDPNDEYIPMDEDYDYDLLFSWRAERVISDNNMFSYNGYYYMPVDEKTGEPIPIRKSVKVLLRQSVETGKVKIFRQGKWIDCAIIGKSSKPRKEIIINDQKDIEELYKEEIKVKGSSS